MRLDRSVLVLTCAEDPTADAVIAELDKRHARIARHDLGDFSTRARLRATHGPDGWTGTISGPNGDTALQDVGAVYYRRPSRFTFPAGMSPVDRAFADTEARLGLGGVLAALPCGWVNHPHDAARAEWKPLQLEVARECGLATPRSLVSNDLAEAVEFAATADGPVVCKALSSITMSEGGRTKLIYTTPVDVHTIDPVAFGSTAHLLQDWVPKAREARVTVVGSQIFPVAIEADSPRAHIDWRADYGSIRYRPIEVPDELRPRMLDYLRRFNLRFGAFDFVITPDGRWVMLECNPSGQWLWLHHVADLAVPAALADLLCELAS